MSFTGRFKTGLFFVIAIAAFILILSSCGQLQKDNEEEIQKRTRGQSLEASGGSVNPIVLGKTLFPLNTFYDEVALCEQGTGDLVADAMKALGAGVDMAFINAGSIRRRGVTGKTAISAGDITIGDLVLLFPFDNLIPSLNRARPSTIVLISLTGKVLKEVFENSLSRRLPTGPGTSFGRFLQVSGIEVYADVLKAVGSRITRLVQTSTGLDIDMNDDITTYRVAIPLKYIKDTARYSDFDKYWDIFAKGTNVVDTGVFLFDATVDFIRKNTPLSYPANCSDPGSRLVISN